MTDATYGLRISESARSALEALCKESGYADPVVMIFTGSDSLPIGSQTNVHNRKQEITDQIAKTPLPLDFELVVQCVPKSTLPEDTVSDFDGILVNAPISSQPEDPVLHLDFRDNEFLLLNDAGEDVSAMIGELVNEELKRLK